jgi:hypothetical protein
MAPEELAQMLVGKTIQEVKWHAYLKWPMCVSSIVFTDGTIVDVAGNADEGHFQGVSLPNGEYHEVESPEELDN